MEETLFLLLTPIAFKVYRYILYDIYTHIYISPRYVCVYGTLRPELSCIIFIILCTSPFRMLGRLHFFIIVNIRLLFYSKKKNHKQCARK